MTSNSLRLTQFEFSYSALRPTLVGSSGQFDSLEADLTSHESDQDVLMESGAYGTCYQLLRKHENRPGHTISPLLEARNPENEVGVANERRANIGNFQRVLVAEDHPGTRRMLVQMLRRWGFEAIPAASGTEVLKLAGQKRTPELILLSRMLPGMDFFELCRRLNGRCGDYAPYILVLAMQSDKQEVVRALESGAAEYLTTPFEAEELRARLLVATRILRRQESLITSRDRFRLLAAKDTLTGLWNRRSIDQILNDELERAARAERNTGVLLIDLDHFKKVNDTHGHLAGDFVLQEASRRLKDTVRAYDSIGRYGGEEFLVIVPGSAEGELCELAERLRKAIEKDPVRVGEHEIRITLSVGAAIAPAGENQRTDLVACADGALYEAKELGRNRSVFADRQLKQALPIRSLERTQLHCTSATRA